MVNLVQVDSQLGIVLSKYLKVGGHYFSLILVVKTESNLGMAKIKLNQAAEKLMEHLNNNT
jgi:predicted regulator of Ras-like GTPase activity (Roadblock/LC7/MglB family)